MSNRPTLMKYLQWALTKAHCALAEWNKFKQVNDDIDTSEIDKHIREYIRRAEQLHTQIRNDIDAQIEKHNRHGVLQGTIVAPDKQEYRVVLRHPRGEIDEASISEVFYNILCDSIFKVPRGTRLHTSEEFPIYVLRQTEVLHVIDPL